MIKSKKRTATVQYRYFTGEGFGRIVSVNPDKKNYIKLRNITSTDDIDDPQYLKVVAKTTAYDLESDSRVTAEREYTAIDFYVKYDPNQILELDTKNYSEDIKHFRVFISNRLDLTKFNDIVYVTVIDSHGQTCLVPYLKDKTAKECLVDAQSYPDVNVAVLKVDPDTVRFAREGEAILYATLYNASSLAPHNPTGEGDAYNDLSFQFTKEDGSDAWEEIVKGEFGYIRDFLKSDWTRDIEGNPVYLGFFLVVNPYEVNGQTRFYNQIFTSPFVHTTFRTTTNSRQYVIDDNTYNTRLNKSALKSLIYMREKGNIEWTSTEFSEYDRSTYVPPVTTVNATTTTNTVAGYDDDLPF